MKIKRSTLLTAGVLVVGLGVCGRLLAARGPRAAPPSAAAAQGRATRRLQLSDLKYRGAFRLPDGYFGSPMGFSFGGAPVAYNPPNNSLFIGGHTSEGRIAEVSIPTAINSAEVSDLPFATVLQPLSDPTDGQASSLYLPGNMVYLGGLLMHGGKLYGTAYIYYDANAEQRVSHYSRSSKLNQSNATALQSVWRADATGFVSGYLASVPAEWKERLGGPAITGQCCIPIVSRTSWGPSAFAWNPADLGVKKPAPATPLVYYTGDHPTVGPWEGSGPVYGATTQIGGLALIAGTRTALFFGSNGTGTFCYGAGTGNAALAGKRMPGSPLVYCYDPFNENEGTHAYPYAFQVWAYDLEDWASVKAGRKQPWDIKPYGVWPLSLPWTYGLTIGGVGYDEERQLLYVSQLQVDEDGGAYRPVVHVLHVE